MDQPQIIDVDPSYEADYVGNYTGRPFDVPGLLEQLQASRAAGTTILSSNVGGQRFSSVDTYELVKRKIHENRGIPYVRLIGELVVLGDATESQAGGRAYAPDALALSPVQRARMDPTYYPTEQEMIDMSTQDFTDIIMWPVGIDDGFDMTDLFQDGQSEAGNPRYFQRGEQ